MLYIWQKSFGKYVLAGTNYSTNDESIKQSIGDFIEHKLNDYLASHSEVSETIKCIIRRTQKRGINNIMLQHELFIHIDRLRAVFLF